MNRAAWIIGFASFLFSPVPTIAQVTSDNLTGTIVTPNGNVSEITGGTTVGGRNLFHSFDRFDVPFQGEASFLNDPGIVNIFSRVTGGKVSEIDGVLRSRGSANFFLMNPNGIVFKENASLDIGGSFVATTANAIQFPNGVVFSSTSPVESQNSLLAVDPSAFLFNQTSINPIETRASMPTGFLTALGNEITGLRVPNEQSLLLIGGDLNFDGGRLNALGGRIELGGLASPGVVRLVINQNTFSLNFPATASRSNVTLDNDARVSVRGTGGGSLLVHANRISATNGARLVAGTEGARNGGNIIIDSNEVNLSGFIVSDSFQLSISGIYNQTTAGASGNAGDVIINTKKFSAASSATVTSNTLSQSTGNAGNVLIKSNSFSASDRAGIGSVTNSVGKGGNLILHTNSLSLTDGAILTTQTFGDGSAGKLEVVATDSVSIVGDGSGITASTRSLGKGGDISLTTGSLFIRQQGVVSTSTSTQGNAGDIVIRATDIDLSDTSTDASMSSSIRAQSSEGATGNAGNLTVSTVRLVLREGAKISTSAQGEGQGGNLTITARESIEVIGRSLNGRTTPSGIFARTEGMSDRAGNGGDLRISTQRLSIRDGGQISASTFSRGNAGNITINATAVEVIGIAANGFQGGIFAQSNPRAQGNGGDLTIDTNRLVIRDGGLITVSTLGRGQSGTLRITAYDSVEITGTSEVFKSPSLLTVQSGRQSVGNAKNLLLTTNQLTVRDQAQIFVGSLGAGKAGTLGVIANSILLDQQGRLTAETVSGNGGNINLAVSNLLLLRRGGGISTTAGAEQAGGDGGNIDINAKFLVAVPRENSDISANAFRGTGGRVLINTSGIFGTQFRQLSTAESDITASSTFGASGLVILNTPDNSSIQNSLNELPQTAIDTNALLANSCIARNEQNGTFFITGTGGLRTNPGELSTYSTGTIQPVNSASSWKRGDAIVEPQGVYQLPNGALVLSRECS